jgi:glycosyltransferase involved in cell wall biosynthesis
MTPLQTDAPPVIPHDSAKTGALRLLFAKHDLSFPRLSGHDLRAYNMMRALAQLGHHIGLATVEEPSARAIAGLRLDWQGTLTDPAHGRFAGAPELTVLQARFASYFGVTRKQMIALGGIARRFQADAIIGMGPDIPPYLAAAGTIPCVWYVGDEWVSHYSSLFKPREVRTWRFLKSAAIWGLYERVFAQDLERIWVVSDREERQMRRWTSATHVDSLPNGVDSDYFAPMLSEERPNTAIFWGRLDFAPNLQALQWFCATVWPMLRQRFADAEFRIVGFHPGKEARQLAQLPGVVLSPDLEDLRPTVGQHAVVVMPFHSGGGIKNKLLEAASMGKAVVCTSMACGGLRGDPALIVAESPEEWVTAISDLWRDATARKSLGRRAREWTLREHSWGRTAQDAVRTLRLTARV